MSLINEIEQAVEIYSPPVPGEGPIVYFQGYGSWIIAARLAPGDSLAKIYSWQMGDDFWIRCYAC